MNTRIQLSEQLNHHWIQQDMKEKKKLMDKNNNQIVIWGVAIAILGVAELYFEFFGGQLGLFLTKPFTMIAILLQPALIGNGLVNSYQKAILLGLMASVLGDVFLMVPGDYFLYGLLCFLTAHITYTVGFFRDTERELGARINWISLIPFLLFGIAAYATLVYFGDMEMPIMIAVGVYTLAIVVMAWQAKEHMAPLVNGRRELARYAFIGSILFLVSDLTLAFNRFVAPFEYAPLLIMSTYFTAQYLLARSAIVLPRRRF